MKKDDFQDILTLASVIGNILQAVDDIEKNNIIDLKDVDVRALLKDKNILQSQLQNIYNAYLILKSDAEELKNINTKLAKNIKENENEINRLKIELSSLEKELELKEMKL